MLSKQLLLEVGGAATHQQEGLERKPGRIPAVAVDIGGIQSPGELATMAGTLVGLAVLSVRLSSAQSIWKRVQLLL